MALFIKKNNQLVKVGEVAKALEPDKLDLRLAQTTYYTYENNDATAIPSYAFYDDKKITEVKFPNATSIGNYTFYGCSNLEKISAPKLTTINYSAFYQCSKLTTVNFPLLTKLGNNAFEQCGGLTEVNFPEVTQMGGSCFNRCYRLKKVNLPKITSIPGGAFQYCQTINDLNFPLVTTIGNGAFANSDSEFTNISATAFPEVTNLTYACFSKCTYLQTVVFPKVTSIESNVFQNCYWLRAITLGASTVCTLAATNAISQTYVYPLTIYVPSNLVESYKTATNWSTLYNNGYITFSAIGTETGYTLSVGSFVRTISSQYYFSYSFDNIRWKEIKADTVLYNVTNIYIKAYGFSSGSSMAANSHFISAKMGANLTGANSTATLFTLTQNVDDIDILITNH